MKVLSALGASVKSAIKSLPFSSYGGYGYGLGGMSGGYLPGISLTGGGFMGGNLPGTNFDYRTAAGVLWENPSAAACFMAYTNALAQSRPYLEKYDGKVWEKVESHPLTDLLNKPNNSYSGKSLFGVTLISTLANEAGFWRFERNGADEVAEIWFEPPVGVGPTGIAPAWDSAHFIKEYYYFVDGKRMSEPIPIEDVVYFRNGLNPANARLPWSPLAFGSREISTLNGASTYTGALMNNSAVPSGMVTLEGSALASGTAPSPEQAEEMKQKIKAGFRGDNVGEPFVSSLPWKWTPFNWSPADLSIDKIRQWPQGIVCALLQTPEIVALLPTGEQPTYENLAASMEWWWNNSVIPQEDAFADEIETQMFPAFGLDPKEYRLAWDRSKVPALQEDVVAKNKMIDDSYTAGVIDLYEAQTQRGVPDVPEEYKGRFHPSATAGDPQAAPVTPEEAANQERLSKAVKSFDPDQPRDDDGKWSGGGSTSHNSSMTNTLPKGWTITEEPGVNIYTVENPKIDANGKKRTEKYSLVSEPGTKYKVIAPNGEQAGVKWNRDEAIQLAQARAKQSETGSEAATPREVIKFSEKRTPNTVLVARYSDDIDADIKRGWSAFQHAEAGGTKEEVVRDAREMGLTEEQIKQAVRKSPNGGYTIVHHEGLSSYLLNSDSVDKSQDEAINSSSMGGSGYGVATIGKIRKMRTIPKEIAGSQRDLHILEVPDVKQEEYSVMTGKSYKADDQHAQRMAAELKAAPPLPEDNPDPFGMAFTQEEIDKLTDIDEASVKAAFANSTPEMRALLSARQIDTNDAETPER